MPKAARGAEPLHEQILRAAAPRVRHRRGREEGDDAEERDGGYVGPRLARRILREARKQQEELEAEHGPGAPARPPQRCAAPRGPDSEEDEEDEEWPSLQRAAEWDGRCGGGDVEVDPEDEKALEVFMSRAPPLRCGAGGGGGGGERTGSADSSAPTPAPPAPPQADAGGCHHGEDHGEADGGADGAVGAVGPPHAPTRPPRAGGVQRCPRGEGAAAPRPHIHLWGNPTRNREVGSSHPRRSGAGTAAASLRDAVELYLMMMGVGGCTWHTQHCPTLGSDPAQPSLQWSCAGSRQLAYNLETNPTLPTFIEGAVQIQEREASQGI